MNERNRQEDKWEKIVELCEEGHYLSEEELEQWSNDPEALDVCKELLRCKNAVAVVGIGHLLRSGGGNQVAGDLCRRRFGGTVLLQPVLPLCRI